MKIFLNVDGSRFEEREIDSVTVGELRCEFDLTDHKISVDRVIANDDQSIDDGAFVSAVKKNKVGGSD